MKVNFKLMTKVVDPLNNFWVTNYNEEEKQFFLSIGFKEKKSPAPKSFGGSDTLEFKGNGMFGFWTDDEFKTICEAMNKHFQAKKGFTVYQQTQFD